METVDKLERVGRRARSKAEAEAYLQWMAVRSHVADISNIERREIDKDWPVVAETLNEVAYEEAILKAELSVAMLDTPYHGLPYRGPGDNPEDDDGPPDDVLGKQTQTTEHRKASYGPGMKQTAKRLPHTQVPKATEEQGNAGYAGFDREVIEATLEEYSDDGLDRADKRSKSKKRWSRKEKVLVINGMLEDKTAEEIVEGHLTDIGRNADGVKKQMAAFVKMQTDEIVRHIGGRTGRHLLNHLERDVTEAAKKSATRSAVKALQKRREQAQAEQAQAVPPRTDDGAVPAVE